MPTHRKTLPGKIWANRRGFLPSLGKPRPNVDATRKSAWKNVQSRLESGGENRRWKAHRANRLSSWEMFSQMPSDAAVAWFAYREKWLRGRCRGRWYRADVVNREQSFRTGAPSSYSVTLNCFQWRSALGRLVNGTPYLLRVEGAY